MYLKQKFQVENGGNYERAVFKMADLTHLFKVGQIVKCRLDGDAYTGTVKETYTDHIIVDIPDVSDHCWFESGFNIGDVQPVYDFCSGGKKL